MIDHVVSKSGYLIRLTAERWTHITEEHCELAGLLPDSSETGETGGKSATGRDRAHTSRESRSSRLSRATPPFCDEKSAVAFKKEAGMAIADIQEYLKLIPAVNRSPQHAVWLTYDAEADSLYVNFKKPSHATDSEMTDDDVIIRYEGEEIIGFTVLHAGKRMKKTA